LEIKILWLGAKEEDQTSDTANYLVLYHSPALLHFPLCHFFSSASHSWWRDDARHVCANRHNTCTSSSDLSWREVQRVCGFFRDNSSESNSRGLMTSPLRYCNYYCCYSKEMQTLVSFSNRDTIGRFTLRNAFYIQLTEWSLSTVNSRLVFYCKRFYCIKYFIKKNDLIVSTKHIYGRR